MARKTNKWTQAVKGVGAEIRMDGFSWKAVVSHLGGGGTRYFKFNGHWYEVVQSDMPSRVYRALRKVLRENIDMATRHLRTDLPQWTKRGAVQAMVQAMVWPSHRPEPKEA
jgi:hypothetical protein